jgi:hypothetical protein
MGNRVQFCIVAMLGFFAVALPFSTIASDLYRVTETDKKFLSEIVEAVKRKDAPWIAEHMAYPVLVNTANGDQLVKGKKKFSAILSIRFTDSAFAKLPDDARKPLFKNWQGVMVGNGTLWFSECRVSEREPWRPMILTIAGVACQPEEGVHPQAQADGMQPFRN